MLLHFDGALRRQGGEAQAREAEAFAPIMDPRCYRSGRRQKLGYVWYYHKGQEGWTEFQHQFEDILTTQMFAIVGWDQIEHSKVAEFVKFEAKYSEERELDFLR